jgi:hypothetical protein
MKLELNDLKNAIHAKRTVGRLKEIRRCFKIYAESIKSDDWKHKINMTEHMFIGGGFVVIVWLGVRWLG